MVHPEYAKLFSTYLELQRYQAIQEATPGDLELTGSAEKQEESTSDKKDDWAWDRGWLWTVLDSPTLERKKQTRVLPSDFKHIQVVSHNRSTL